MLKFGFIPYSRLVNIEICYFATTCLDRGVVFVR